MKNKDADDPAKRDERIKKLKEEVESLKQLLAEKMQRRKQKRNKKG